MDDLAGGPVQRLVCLLARFLLLQHLVKKRNHPVLESAVVAVGHDEVADPVHALLPQSRTGRREGAQVGWRQTFDEILLYAACRRHNGRDVVVLDQVA